MKSDSEVQNCEYIKNEGGMYFNRFLLILNIFYLLAGVVQLFTVSLIPYNDRNGHLQLIFNLALVPVPARDYTGKEQVILILCLMAHVLSCVCVIYVVGRAVYDPKFTAGSPKIKVNHRKKVLIFTFFVHLEILAFTFSFDLSNRLEARPLVEFRRICSQLETQ